MGLWVHLKLFLESMDMRQLFGCGKNSTECLSGCKNIKLQKSHCYSINQIFWNSKSDFSKIVLIFDHFFASGGMVQRIFTTFHDFHTFAKSE